MPKRTVVTVSGFVLSGEDAEDIEQKFKKIATLKTRGSYVDAFRLCVNTTTEKLGINGGKHERA